MFIRALAFVIVVIGAGIANGQSDALTPKWEAVSIKPCTPGGRGVAAAPQGPGRLTMVCAPVEVLIHHSYLLFPDGTLDLAGAKTQVTQGPSWMYSDPYTVEAKAEAVPGQSPPGQGMMQGPMLRALLAERFKLEVHRGTKQVPVYALAAAKDGPRIQAAKEGSCIVADLDHPAPPPVPGQPMLPACGLPRSTGGAMDFHGATMSQIAAALSTRTDRKVIDKTGMEGKFDLQLIWSDDLPSRPTPPPPPGRPGAGLPPPPPPPPPGDPGMGAPDAGEITGRIQGALQKFGLKLEPAMGPEDVLIVDHVERPSGN